MSLNGFLILAVSNYLAIWTIQASTRCCFPWVSLLVVTSLALIEEVGRIEADLWVVAVHIVKPYLVMDYEPRLHATHLADSTIQSHALLNESPPCSLPCLGLVELFLSQHLSGSLVVVAIPELHWRSCRSATVYWPPHIRKEMSSTSKRKET